MSINCSDDFPGPQYQTEGWNVKKTTNKPNRIHLFHKPKSIRRNTVTRYFLSAYHDIYFSPIPVVTAYGAIMLFDSQTDAHNYAQSNTLCRKNGYQVLPWPMPKNPLTESDPTRSENHVG